MANEDKEGRLIDSAKLVNIPQSIAPSLTEDNLLACLHLAYLGGLAVELDVYAYGPGDEVVLSGNSRGSFLFSVAKRMVEKQYAGKLVLKTQTNPYDDCIIMWLEYVG